MIVKIKSEKKKKLFLYPNISLIFFINWAPHLIIKKNIFKLPGNRVMLNLKKKMNILAFKTYLAGFLVAAYGKDHYLKLFLHCTQVKFASFEFEFCLKRI